MTTYNQLRSELKTINIKIQALQSIEADRADIDELIHQRTKIAWAIVSKIDESN